MTTEIQTAPMSTLNVRKQGKEFLLRCSTYTVARFATRESAELVLALAIYRASLMSDGEYSAVGPYRIAQNAEEEFLDNIE